MNFNYKRIKIGIKIIPILVLFMAAITLSSCGNGKVDDNYIMDLTFHGFYDCFVPKDKESRNLFKSVKFEKIEIKKSFWGNTYYVKFKIILELSEDTPYFLIDNRCADDVGGKGIIFNLKSQPKNVEKREGKKGDRVELVGDVKLSDPQKDVKVRFKQGDRTVTPF